jgi:hypothetical protein
MKRFWNEAATGRQLYLSDPSIPNLDRVVEFDVAVAVDLQPAQFMKRHSLCP